MESDGRSRIDDPDARSCTKVHGGRLQHVIMHKLSDAPYSGYALCKEIERMSGHKPSYGSVYPILERMVCDGFVTVKRDGRRKIYSMTPAGKQTVAVIKQHYSQHSDHMKEEIRVFCEMTGNDPDPIIDLFERYSKGENPLGNASVAVFKLRRLFFKMVQDDKVRRNEKKVIKILDDAKKKLERLK